MSRPAPPPPVVRVRILLWRTRRLWPALGLLLVVLLIARTVAPPPPASVPIVVLARSADAGATLTAADVRLVRVGTCCVPDGATDDLTTHVGRELAVAVPRGLPLVEDLLRGPRFAVEPDAGTVVVPVVLVQGSAALRAGDRVDLVSTELSPPDGDGAPAGGVAGQVVLARAALVVDVPEPAEPGLLGGPDGGEGAVLVAVSPAEGHALAARSGWAPLGAVLVE